MPTIKNVSPRPDDLHDGRPLPAFETADITPDDLDLPHYQQRIDDGTLLVVDETAAAAPKVKPATQEASK